MTNISNNAVTADKLATLRHNVATTIGKQYGAMRVYAKALNASLFITDARGWYDVEENDTDELAAPVLAEKKAFYAELKAIKHSNASVVWKRIRKYGKEEAIAAGTIPDPKKSEAGEGAGEGDGAPNGSGKRSAMLRNMEELIALYKFNMKTENLPEQVVQCNQHIENALRALGVDIRTL